MTNKMKLTITQLSEPQKIGDKGAVKLSLKAKDEAGKEETYFTFTKRLFPLIQAGQTIEADVDVTERDVGDAHYTDRKIVEVAGAPQAPPSGSGFQPRSPEERHSIEQQVAFKGVIELLVGKVIDIDHTLSQYAINWASKRLAPPTFMVAFEKISPPIVSEEGKAKTTGYANWGEWAGWCANHGVWPATVLKKAGKKNLGEFTSYDEATAVLQTILKETASGK